MMSSGTTILNPVSLGVYARRLKTQCRLKLLFAPSLASGFLVRGKLDITWPRDLEGHVMSQISCPWGPGSAKRAVRHLPD